jgi:hypothetical protein
LFAVTPTDIPFLNHLRENKEKGETGSIFTFTDRLSETDHGANAVEDVQAAMERLMYEPQYITDHAGKPVLPISELSKLGPPDPFQKEDE